MHYVYSTLTCDNIYTGYSKPADRNALPLPIKQVTIRGGSNVANKHFVTPKGVVTQVNDEDLEFLESNPGFKQHKENGFIKVEKKEVDVEKVVKNMREKDLSAPKTPKDFEKKVNNDSDNV